MARTMVALMQREHDERKDAAYLESVIRDGTAHEVMDMVREMDAIVHLLEIEDDAETPCEAIKKLIAKINK